MIPPMILLISSTLLFTVGFGNTYLVLGVSVMLVGEIRTQAVYSGSLDSVWMLEPLGSYQRRCRFGADTMKVGLRKVNRPELLSGGSDWTVLGGESIFEYVQSSGTLSVLM